MPQRVNDNLKSSNTWVWNNMRVSKLFIWIIQTWTHNTMWPCAQRRSDSSFSCLFCWLFLSTQNAWIQKVKKKPPRKPQALWLLCKQEEAPTQQSASLITQTDTSLSFFTRVRAVSSHERCKNNEPFMMMNDIVLHYFRLHSVMLMISDPS